MSLPLPEVDRWQPLRCGLVNLYRFDAEEFRYHRGRLLLRGNNGTGKSRVLALQLPFLLDGEVASHRLEPDGDQAKRIEWNLLMNRHTDRLGYTWLELGRLTPEGPRYVTLGCGLNATEGRGLLSRWLFLTHQRVGESLFLMTPARTALTKDRLVEAIGGHGRVFSTAKDYRQAVDAELFGLGTDRYDALVELLIALRQPQLSRKLDEAKLTSTLTQALPRLADGLLAEVAEAFRTLEADRQTLRELESTQRILERFLGDYRHYLQMALRRRAATLREGHNRYENSLRLLREAQEKKQALEVQEEGLNRRLAELEGELAEAAQRFEMLSQSPEMKSAREIEAAEREVRERAQLTQRLARDFEQASGSGERAVEAAARARAFAADQQERAASTHGELARVWQASALPPLPELEGSFAECGGQLKDRQQRVKLLEKRNTEVRQAEQELARARQAVEDALRQLEETQEGVRAAQARLAAAARQLGEDARIWQASLRELRLPAEVLDDLREWAEDPDAERADEPLTAAVREGRDSVREALAEQRHALQATLAREEEVLRELTRELEELRSGRHQPPPPSPYRVSREGLAGAPLYMLCDFADEVPAPERAGLEAALEASGLLDAWVTPDGRLLPADRLDAALVAGGEPVAANLGARLRAQAPVVTSLLAQIGLGENGTTWVSADGSWRVGPLQGRWRKSEAEHVGQGAREEKRRRRMAELEAELQVGDQRRVALREQLQELARRGEVLEGEVRAVPSLAPIHEGRVALEKAQERVRDARARAQTAEERQAEARRSLDESRGQRDQDARDLGLQEWSERTGQLLELLGQARELLGSLLPRLENLAESRRQVTVATLAAEEAQQRAAEAGERFRSAEILEKEARTRHQVLLETVGAAVADVLRKLDEARVLQEELKKENVGLGRSLTEVVRQLGGLNSECVRHQEESEVAAGARQEAADRLGSLLERGVLPLAAPEVDATDFTRSITRAVDVARALEAVLAAVEPSEEAWKRRQTTIYQRLEELKTELTAGDFRPESTLEGEVLLVSVPYQGLALTLGELGRKLADDVAFRNTLLSAREREVIENHLINDISLQLHELLHQAEDWVEKVNRELESRPTSSGMKLRFKWEARPDGPAGLEEARRRLLRKGATWTPQEREALGDFLQRQIEAARQRTPGASWLEHLRAGLDYRSWHRISIERWQDKQWTRLTRMTHGTGSGGEKAIALTVPQFAAAAAYYSSAGPHAPRLILLDEAFVGVDAKMRGQCMGMLEAFDLDFVMTSEREWGTYAELKGTAIYQLTAREGVDAVYATRWVWNGRERTLAPVEPAPAFASAGG